jgi:hypothetical protein
VRQLESPSLPTGVRDLLSPLVTLFAASSVERELSWYLTQEVVTPKVGVLNIHVFLTTVGIRRPLLQDPYCRLHRCRCPWQQEASHAHQSVCLIELS